MEFNLANESSAIPTVLAMAVGIPNSGKSTLINALRGIGRAGSGGAARVGRNAGQTRSIGQPVLVSRGSAHPLHSQAHAGQGVYEPQIMILDTPGILEPRVLSLPQQLSLCVCGAIDWGVVDQGKSH